MKRDLSVDWLKGFAILLVVMAHELQWCMFHLAAGHTLLDGSTSYVQQWINSFHMPLFFFLSGLLMGGKQTQETLTANEMWRSIWRKVQTLLLPGLTWMLVKYYINGEWYMEWFLRVLFMSLALFTILHYVSGKLKMKLWMEAIVHIGCFFGLLVIAHSLKGSSIYSMLYLRKLADSYPFVAFGYFFMNKGWATVWRKNNYWLTISMIVFVVAYSLYYRGLCTTSWAVYPFPFIIAFSAILSLYAIADKVLEKKSKLNDVLCYMGKKSLAIYIIHFYFLIGVPQVADFWVYLTEHAVSSFPAIAIQVVYGLVASSILIAICLLFEYVLAQSQILNFLCFGKDIKKDK